MTARVHLCIEWLRLVAATHAPLTLRPLTVCVNVKVTLAVTLRLNENVVPTGSFDFAAIVACLLPSRHFECDWWTAETTGVGAGLIAIGIVRDVLLPYASVTVKVAEKLRAAVGVPVIAPLAPLM